LAELPKSNGIYWLRIRMTIGSINAAELERLSQTVTGIRLGVAERISHFGVNALNVSFNFLEPFSGFGRFFHSKSVPPTSVNIMPFVNPESDKLLDEAEKTFDLAKQDAILAKLHELVVEEAPWIFVAHDLNPRAMSPKVKGFVPPQSWFVDLTPVSVGK